MKLADRIISKLSEEFKDDQYVPKKYLNTKVRSQAEKKGSRSARIMVQEANKILTNMLNPKHDSPNPKTEADMVKIKESLAIGKEMAKHIKSVKDTKGKMK